MWRTDLFLVIFVFQLVAGHPNVSNIPRDSIIVIPSTAQTGLSDAQFAFNNEELDTPELALVNSTAWEWCYDVVAPDQTS